MSELSIQFWIMIGTLTTAGGTLVLGVGVVIAGLQLKHARESPERDRKKTAVQTYLAAKNILAMRAKSARWQLGDMEDSVSATRLLVSTFNLSGTHLQASLLSVDMLLGTLAKEIYEIQTGDSTGGNAADPGESRKRLLVQTIWESAKIVEKLQNKKAAADALAHELDLLIKQFIETLEGLSDGMQ